MAESKEADAPPPGSESSRPESEPTPTLEQARRFLNDETVRSASKEKKSEFLRGKGFSDDDIQKLLSEEASREGSTSDDRAQDATDTKDIPNVPQSTSTPAQAASAPLSEPAPIITYPEFLTHSPKPPPLLTPSRLLTAATVLTTAWTLAYGAARFIVAPMVDTLAESRSEYYEHVNTKLSTLVEKLEGVVSEVPYSKGKLSKSDADGDDNSSYGDPSEMFHRDVGTQTSPFTTELPIHQDKGCAVDQQARQLTQLTTCLKELSTMYTTQAENSSNLHLAMQGIREDVDKLAYPATEYSSLYGGSTFGLGRSDPDDEIKKTKDAIRSVKGMFLSSRMFPSTGAAPVR
ncbi:hypothetical protein PFICI_09309 [Pestalotiopsis fici W106-1]|uniref:Peroxisomal membrane protein PEX14 n=1 Tax=Pestalotiopsis fici (strain W106-1 / CGMCC3.15140) TaxID=1229662 RepID=W3X2T3_PESFW|nr:uncharacterized protein PFICI_09309 [Pestalotiopsis fici W106-1]ETS79456.1 hypothetical protein PFICI_09309 [Pestalotiopsis fici W106-1]